MPVVQLYFNTEDYKNLEERARDQGYETISEFIRGQLLPEGEYVRYLRILMRRAESAAPGTYTVSSLIGPAFYDLPVGVRFSLGRAFFRLVNKGDVPNISSSGEINGSQTYSKREE